MSYPTTVTGRITITPPLTHAELHGHPGLLANWESGGRQAWVEVSESPVETAEGTLIRRSGATVRGYEGEFTPCHLSEHIQEIVDAFPDREFTGYLECFCGGDGGDTWRLVIRDRKVAEIRPRIVWPDEPGGTDAST